MAQRLLPILLMVAAVFLIGDRLYSKEAAPQCAFISEVSGKAVVQRDGKYYLIRGMDGIYCGERVKVMAGAKVVAAECGANLKTEIVGPAEFTVERNKLIFKKGKAENPVKIDGELCPFFLAQSFVNPKLTQVDGRGNQLPPERYATFVMKSIAPSRPMTSEFFGYLSEIKGDVYFSQPSVLKITGDVVPPGGAEIFSRADSGLAIYSCAENKKYLVEGSALIRIAVDNPEAAPVTFVAGKAAKIEDLDPAECEAARQAALAVGRANLKPVGLDGK